jgi:hypothetical protein
MIFDLWALERLKSKRHDYQVTSQPVVAELHGRNSEAARLRELGLMFIRRVNGSAGYASTI